MRPVIAVFTAVSTLLTATAAVAAQNGERWEYTTKMQSDQAQGFAMPAMTMQMCQEPGWKNPPKGQQQDEECKVRDYKKSGNTMSWRVECPQGKGYGEMTLQGSDKFTGFTEFTTEDGQFRMDMTGRKLGSCDPAADRTVVNGMSMPNAQEIQQMQANMNQQMEMANAQSCASAIQSMQLMIFTMDGSPCAKQKPAFCKRLQTGDGAMMVVGQDASGEALNQAIAFCGLGRDKVVGAACKQAKATKNWEFLALNCKAEADELAQQHCAGRDFTTVYATEYGSFCTQYAAELMSDGGKVEKKEESTVEKGAKLLKDLIKW